MYTRLLTPYINCHHVSEEFKINPPLEVAIAAYETGLGPFVLVLPEDLTRDFEDDVAHRVGPLFGLKRVVVDLHD